MRGLGPCAALWYDRARYLWQLGDGAGAEAAEREAKRVPPAGARDHYLLATTYVRGGGEGRAKAIAELTEATGTRHRRQAPRRDRLSPRYPARGRQLVRPLGHELYLRDVVGVVRS